MVWKGRQGLLPQPLLSPSNSNRKWQLCHFRPSCVPLTIKSRYPLNQQSIQLSFLSSFLFFCCHSPIFDLVFFSPRSTVPGWSARLIGYKAESNCFKATVIQCEICDAFLGALHCSVLSRYSALHN